MRWKKWLDDANFTVKEEPLYDRFIFTETLEAPIGNQVREVKIVSIIRYIC
jgi:hypothetical protein